MAEHATGPTASGRAQQPPPCKVVVIGAGLAGVTAAYALVHRSRQQGRPCSVTLLDRRDEVALETSFANAGRFCPSSLALGSPAQAAGLRRAFVPSFLLDTPLFRQGGVDQRQPRTSHMRVDFTRPRLLYWGLCNVFLSNPDASRLLEAHRLLAHHTVKMMDATLARLPPDDVAGLAITPGTLWLYHTEAGMAAGSEKARRVNAGSGFSATMLSASAALARFPWLRGWKADRQQEEGHSSKGGGGDDSDGRADAAGGSGNHNLPGAVYVDQDWSADARKFVQSLAGGGEVALQLRTRVTRLVAAGVEVETADGVTEVIRADKVVVACGVHSNALVPNGPRRLPLEGLRGFSVDLYGCTSNALDGRLPDVALADFGSSDLNFQVTPYENGRIRLVGFADFVGLGGMDAERRDSSERGATTTLTSHLRYLFPLLTWTDQRATWCGLRPMTPDNLPYVGRVHVDFNAGGEGGHTGDGGRGAAATAEVYVCCGHGAQGWTSSPATADVLARLVLGASEGDDPDDARRAADLARVLRPERFVEALEDSAPWPWVARVVAGVLDWVLG